MSRNYLCCAIGTGLAAAILLGGCASGQMNRIDANRDIYETWPIETRQAVLDGKVEQGMTPDMVKVAWGTPTEVVPAPGGGPGDEIWVYKSGGEDPSMMNMPSPANPGGGYPSTYPGSMGGGYPGGIYPSGGSTIGIGTGRGGTGIITGSSIGLGGGMGGGGMGGPMSRPTPAEVKEVVFRNGVVYRADLPPEKK